MITEQKYFDLVFALTADEAFSKQTAQELMEADASPAAFFEKHKGQHFTNRGIEKPGHPEQTLCYLLDVLGEKDVVCELDWKADAEELNHAIKLLSHGEISDELVDEDDEEDAEEEGMFELLDLIEDPLQEYGYALVMFNLDSDSYPIALVKKEKYESVQTLIDELFD
ncbi:MAG: DUF6630 family protein [Bacteroidia bacterium]